MASLSYFLVAAYLVAGAFADLVSELRSQGGQVLLPSDETFEETRKVMNAACKAQPAVIVVPKTEEDISTILKTATKHNMEISVRSGGHSYTCTNIKEGGVHIDMRQFDTMEMLDIPLSPTGKALRLGPGRQWGDVLEFAPPEIYSYPHGQCRSVGVAGYLLGGGVNWLGTYNKYGYAAEQVLKMRVVSANGTILDLSPGKTVVHPKYPHETKQYIRNSYDNDLFFAMRGAGSSFGIATEFLYVINRTPETEAAVILVWINDMKDLWKVQEAAYKSNRFSIAINNEFAGDFWNSFKTRIVYKFLPTLLTSTKILHRMGRRGTPLFLTVTDIRPRAPRITDSTPALRYLMSQGVDVVYRSAVVVRIIDNFARRLYNMNIKEQEVQPAGEYNLAGVYLGGMRNTRALENVFFNNPFFGVLRRNNQMFRDIGCDYCFWTIHFRNRQSFPSAKSRDLQISINTDNNKKRAVDSNLVCLFKNRWSQCPREIIKIKKKMEHKLEKYDMSYSKYSNWPSCDSSDWMTRYWGENYPRLL